MIRQLLKAVWAVYEALALSLLDGCCNFLRFAGGSCGVAVGLLIAIRIMPVLRRAVGE